MPTSDGHDLYDALIVGAGPAGASCALWLTRLGLRPLLVEASDRPGGLLNDTPFENNWLVTQPGVTGFGLAAEMSRSLASAGTHLALGCRVVEIREEEGAFIAALSSASGRAEVRVRGRFVVLATGVQPVEGGFRAEPRVLIGPGTEITRQDYTGRSVAILGGGDNAFENYLYVKGRSAAKAHIFARSVRAARAAVQRVPPEDVRIGAYTADGARVQVNGVAYDIMLVMYGWEPRPLPKTGFPLARDDKGFLQVDPATCETSRPGVFAIGEMTRRSHPCVPTAVAEGVIVAKIVQHRTEAS